jgi:hypothetical protein
MAFAMQVERSIYNGPTYEGRFNRQVWFLLKLLLPIINSACDYKASKNREGERKFLAGFVKRIQHKDRNFWRLSHVKNICGLYVNDKTLKSGGIVLSKVRLFSFRLNENGGIVSAKKRYEAQLLLTKMRRQAVIYSQLSKQDRRSYATVFTDQMLKTTIEIETVYSRIFLAEHRSCIYEQLWSKFLANK